MEFDVLALRHDRDEPQLEELPVTDLTAFASLPLDELTAELERMLDNHHAPRRAYVERHFSTAASNRTVNHLTADLVAGGDLIEDRA